MKIKTTTTGEAMFRCPGCDDVHVINVGPSPHQAVRPIWGWNESRETPTFTPSVLVRGNLYGPDRLSFRKYDGPYPCELHDSVCHSFVRDGRIEFLSDCTHALAGQTVDLPDWDDSHGQA